jgi:hypothetical protein
MHLSDKSSGWIPPIDHKQLTDEGLRGSLLKLR